MCEVVALPRCRGYWKETTNQFVQVARPRGRDCSRLAAERSRGAENRGLLCCIVSGICVCGGVGGREAAHAESACDRTETFQIISTPECACIIVISLPSFSNVDINSTSPFNSPSNIFLLMSLEAIARHIASQTGSRPSLSRTPLQTSSD